MKRRLFFVLLTGSLLLIAFFASFRPPAVQTYADSPQQRDGRFRNAVEIPKLGVWEMTRLFFTVMLNKPAGTEPTGPIPVDPITRADLDAAPDRSLWRLGHSTVLLKLRGGYWLTDPVFSKRASPVQWAGPARFHAPPIALADLPPITGIVLSHDHFDHLDRKAILALAGTTTTILTPLGVGDRLIGWGVDAAKVRQLDWWQETDVDGLRFALTPAQHFSGRGLGDSDRTLWASWVIVDDDLRVFFSGDGGYSDAFAAIGTRYGPFDLALVESGAYDAKWPLVHMQPEQTLQAFRDLRADVLLPIHNGTFDLALHPWQEPFERITALAADAALRISTPRMGERVAMSSP